MTGQRTWNCTRWKRLIERSQKKKKKKAAHMQCSIGIHSLDLVKKQTFFRNVWNVQRGRRSLTHVAVCWTWKAANAFKVRLFSTHFCSYGCQTEMSSQMWKGLCIFAFWKVFQVQSVAYANKVMMDILPTSECTFQITQSLLISQTQDSDTG